MPDADKVNILVVDDLPEKVLVLETILADLGQNVVVARSGEEALRRVLGQDFAVILLDVNMPGIDGLETAALIRKRKKSAHTPIIFVTAYADELHTTQCYSLGAVDYILAPVVPEILRSKVKVFVDLSQMARQVQRQAEERVALVCEQAARAAAEEATRRSAFLAEASTILSQSLDPEPTVRALARLVVPFLADLGAVTWVDDQGHERQTEVAWRREPDEIRSQAFPDKAGLPRSLAGVVRRVLETGKPNAVTGPLSWPTVPPPQAARNGQSVPGDAEAILEDLLVLPLGARGRTLGVLCLALGPSGRRYTSADRALAEDLAGRAAIALDNARLHQNIREGERRKDEFLAMLAHELRNPLAPIHNAVHLFRRLGLNEPVLVQARDMIDRQVSHMARLIDDLLDVSRLSRGKILLRTKIVDLVQVVRATVEDYRSHLEATGLEFQVRLPDGPLHVEGDPTRLAQVVGNLLHNATKFTDRGGRVHLELESDPTAAWAALAVRDTGIGMDAEMLGRLFEPFSQADRSLERSRGGLGLGLALVKGLVELHGGQVRASSAGLGQGTEVVIRLPVRPALVPAGAAEDMTSSGPTGRRILIIEDNLDTAESLRILLGLTGHQAEVASTGPAGVQAARMFRPEVVVCDIGLPGGMDGYAVARALRADPELATVYLVAATGYGQAGDQRRAQAAGFDAHLTKPVDFNDLQRLLAALPGKS
jgi:signal transduction histidine kinase/DNA-binding response OmpR family regulator